MPKTDKLFAAPAAGPATPVDIDPSLAFVHPALKAALSYWLAARGAKVMPSRADIQPSGMREFIAHIALIEAPAESAPLGDYTVRLAGTQLETIFGPITGKTVADAVPPAIGERWRNGYNLVRIYLKPFRFLGRIAFDGKTWLTGETLLAPLGEGTAAMIYCAFASWSDDQKR